MGELYILTRPKKLYLIEKKCSASSSSESCAYQLVPTRKIRYFSGRTKMFFYLFVSTVSQELQVNSLVPPM